MIVKLLGFVVLLLIFVEESQQFVFHRIDKNVCYTNGRMLYLESWKMVKCNNNTKYVIFNHCSLLKIDEDAFKNKTIEHLSLDDNELTIIDDWLKPLTQLTILSINHNRIRQLTSENFVQQKKLQILSLSHNEISGIDLKSFTGLDKLVFLSLSHNKITIIRTEYKTLSEIFQLDLSHNRIEYVQEKAFKNLQKLKELHLSHNNLKTLPNNFYAKSILKFLYLSYNRLENVDFIEDSIDLITLDLSNNKLRRLPNYKLPKLYSLYMHDNQLDFYGIKEIFLNHNDTLNYITFDNNNRLTCSDVIELWPILQNGLVKILNAYDYRENVEMREIECDTLKGKKFKNKS